MTAPADIDTTTPASPTWQRPVALVAYALTLALWIVNLGVPADPFQVFVWLWLGAIAWNAGHPWQRHLDFVRDWWPAFLVLVVYLYSRGLSDELIGMPVHWTAPITADEWLGGGQLPTEYLQEKLCGDPCVRSIEPRWYDVLLTTVYYTHFVAGFAIALVLWLRDRVLWVPWIVRYLTMNVSGLIVYVLYPMAPPWLAAKEGHIDAHLPRLTGRGWEPFGLESFHSVLAKVGNPVAAMPSLHAGIAMLIALYAISRLSSPWRWATLVYPMLMAFALVYYAEHYVIDIFAGWALAGGVMWGVGRWERVRSGRARSVVP